MKEITRFRPSIYAILVEKGRVLVCETHTKAKTAFVNFPGGGIKPGEDPAAALVREVDEETGLLVRPRRIVYATLSFHRSYVKPKTQLLGVYWLVERVSGKLKNGNGADVHKTFWATFAELPDLPFTTFDREALPEIMALNRK